MCGRPSQPDVWMNCINIRSNMHRLTQIHHFWQNMAILLLGAEMTMSFTISVGSNSIHNLPFDAEALLRTPDPMVQTAAAHTQMGRWFLSIRVSPAYSSQKSPGQRRSFLYKPFWAPLGDHYLWGLGSSESASCIEIPFCQHQKFFKSFLSVVCERLLTDVRAVIMDCIQTQVIAISEIFLMSKLCFAAFISCLTSVKTLDRNMP
jgi:hypothetical protein